MSSSPDRGTFQAKAALQRAEEGETSAESAADLAEVFKTANQRRCEQEQDPEWQKNNMEYDMRTSDWMVAKTRESVAYAQNLYAAMCNQNFQKNEVWTVLKNQTWSCSWRYAGGIVADMRGEGDYMDWYCSGIQGMDDDQFQGLDEESKHRYLYMKNNFVGEGVVTDQIREDLQKLGWIVIDESDE